MLLIAILGAALACAFLLLLFVTIISNFIMIILTILFARREGLLLPAFLAVLSPTIYILYPSYPKTVFVLLLSRAILLASLFTPYLWLFFVSCVFSHAAFVFACWLLFTPSTKAAVCALFPFMLVVYFYKDYFCSSHI